MDTTRQPLAVGPVTAQPGTRATGLVPLDLGGGASVEVPLALVHGALPGPRVAITAGIHGAEYVSIAALREVVLALDPAEVRGSIVAVLTASPAAFAARSIYVNPLDGRNLNRCFPGDAAGSPTERLARWLTDHVIAGSDAFLDMHCGDMNEALVSFTGIEDTGDAAVDARSRELADAYGLRYLLIGPSPGTTTTAAAGARASRPSWPRSAARAAGPRRTWRSMRPGFGAGSGLPGSWRTRPMSRATPPRSCRPRRGCARARRATGIPQVEVGQRVAGGHHRRRGARCVRARAGAPGGPHRRRGDLPRHLAGDERGRSAAGSRRLSPKRRTTAAGRYSPGSRSSLTEGT